MAIREILYCSLNLILSAAVTYAFYVYRIGKPYGKLYLFALFLKLAATFALAYFYTSHYDYITDPQVYFNRSIEIKQFLIAHPDKIWEVFVDASVPELRYKPRAYFFINVISVLNFLTGDNFWWDGIWLSLICFFCAWHLCLRLKKYFPNTFYPAVGAFLFFPQAIFWSTGLMKESLALGMLYLLMALFADFLCHTSPIKTLFLSIIPLVVLFALKFYVLGAFLLLAFPYFLLHLVGEKITLAPISRYILLGTFIVALFMTGQLFAHYYFSASIFELVYYNHIMIGQTNAQDFYFPHLTGKAGSFLPYFLEAVWQGLFMPLPWNADSFSVLMDGLLNACTLLVVIYLVYRWVRNNSLEFWGQCLLLYILISATAFGYCTPNWGTLARYKVYYVPSLYFLFFFELLKSERTLRILNLVTRFRLF